MQSVCIAGDDVEPASKRPRSTPKPGSKLQPNVPFKVAAGQEFLRKQLEAMDQSMDLRQAKLSANNMAVAAYESEVRLYQQKVKQQEKKNDRLMAVYKRQREDVARSGKTPTPAPCFNPHDCVVLRAARTYLSGAELWGHVVTE